MPADAALAPPGPGRALAPTLPAGARAEASDEAARVLFLLGDAPEPCGIGDFAGRLAASIGAGEGPHRAGVLALGRGTGPRAIAAALAGARTLVCNFPVVAWKRRLGQPPLALALARARGTRVVVILHEWGGLHPLRRLALVPALALADRLLMVSPHVVEELAADPLVGRLAARARLIPLPPNLERPAVVARTPLSRQLAAARAEGRLVLGAFGSIYAGKRPARLLDIAAVLKRRGHRPLVLQAGGFVAGRDQVEAAYWDRARMLGLQDDVVVTGFVDDAAELYGLLDQVDAFAYDLPEGLTARRASVLASLQTGRPVVTTAPARATEFDHHPRYRALIESGAIAFVPRGADPQAFADAVLAALRRPAPPPLDVAAWWRDVAEAVRGEL